jgi:hypothetical protein
MSLSGLYQKEEIAVGHMSSLFSLSETEKILKGYFQCSLILIAVQPHRAQKGWTNFASDTTCQWATYTTHP